MPFFYASKASPSTSEEQEQSSEQSNIADLRNSARLVAENAKLSDEDDDFFKDRAQEEENEAQEVRNEALPSIVQKKIGKILHKLQFVSSVRDSVNVGRGRFNGSASSGELGLENDSAHTQPQLSGFDVSAVGVFLAELVGTLVGLAVGAAAQITNGQNQNRN